MKNLGAKTTGREIVGAGARIWGNGVKKSASLGDILGVAVTLNTFFKFQSESKLDSPLQEGYICFNIRSCLFCSHIRSGAIISPIKRGEILLDSPDL